MYLLYTWIYSCKKTLLQRGWKYLTTRDKPLLLTAGIFMDSWVTCLKRIDYRMGSIFGLLLRQIDFFGVVGCFKNCFFVPCED